MTEHVLHLFSQDDIGEVLDRAAATDEIERGSQALMRQHPERFPATAEGQSDALRLYCKHHPATALVYTTGQSRQVLMEVEE